ncbi:MAG: hypothetical protein OXH04_12475 [Acidobacteria bacterium]|nr:hypothetical protein [Acidobacteriota bacterium]
MKSPLRNVGAAALGYVAVAIVSFVLPMIMWFVLGPDGAFRPDSWETSAAWNAGWIVVAVVGAAAGGFVCAKVAADRYGVWILVAVLLVAGALSLALYVPAEAGVRPADVGMIVGMGAARSPTWLGWLNLPLGAVGALWGARIARQD